MNALQSPRLFDRLVRPAAIAMAAMGGLISHDVWLLTIGGVGVVALSWWIGAIKQYLKFILRLWLPLATLLMVVWAVIVRAAPGEPVGSDWQGGFEYAIVISLRLAVLSGIAQMVFFSLPADRLTAALLYYRVPADAIVVFVASRTLVADLSTRLDQIWTARLARGIVGKPHLLNRIRHFPHLLRPLLAWTLRSAIQRSELWSDRQLIGRLDRSVMDYCESRRFSMVVATASALWCVAAIVFATN